MEGADPHPGFYDHYVEAALKGQRIVLMHTDEGRFEEWQWEIADLTGSPNSWQTRAVSFTLVKASRASL